MRRLWLGAIGLAVALFLFVSALLARVLSANGAEQSAVTALVRAEARGDLSAVLEQIEGCRASADCRQRASHTVSALRRSGTVSIITLQASTSFSPAGTLGTARVAWRVGSSLPIVQCVRVRRAGDAISGLRVRLLAVTPRLPSDAVCPARF